ncbi:MAG: cyclase family protein [Anaerolineae bacterium]|nr:cyclase family protein [Anaerolineae bacterium]
MPIIDISIPLSNSLVVWPSDPPLQVERRRFLERDGANVSQIVAGLHTGTHVDPPLHFIPGGATADQLPLEVLIGPADVVEFLTEERIGAADLEAKGIPEDCQRLLLRTRNSLYWARGEAVFHPDYVGITTDAAAWIVERRIRLVGIDYLAIEPYKTPGHPVHRALLGAQVVILETIDLSAVTPGRYQLVCLPLRISGGDGAPARAVLLS